MTPAWRFGWNDSKPLQVGSSCNLARSRSSSRLESTACDESTARLRLGPKGTSLASRSRSSSSRDFSRPSRGNTRLAIGPEDVLTPLAELHGAPWTAIHSHVHILSINPFPRPLKYKFFQLDRLPQHRQQPQSPNPRAIKSPAPFGNGLAAHGWHPVLKGGVQPTHAKVGCLASGTPV